VEKILVEKYIFISISFYRNIEWKNIVCDVGLKKNKLVLSALTECSYNLDDSNGVMLSKLNRERN